MTQLQPFSPAETEKLLATLSDWEADDECASIFRSWRFGNFDEAMQFINAVADLARSADHHPDMTISYDTVVISLSTHSVGGITEKDADLANRISRLPEAADRPQRSRESSNG